MCFLFEWFICGDEWCGINNVVIFYIYTQGLTDHLVVKYESSMSALT